MRHFSGFSFAFGLTAGAVLTWAGLKLIPLGNSSTEGALKSHARFGSAAVRQPGSGTREFFPQGPLADDSFWSALPQGGAARAAALRGKVSEILASPRLYSRRRWFAAMLEHYQEGDLEAIHEGMMAQEKLGGRFNKEYEQMMERAAEVEGAVVMEIVRKENSKAGSPVHEWHARCMADWSSSDKAGAVAWWNALPDGNLRDSLAGPLIEGIATSSPQDAWNAALLFDPAQRANVAPELVKAFARDRGLEGSMEWVASLGPEDAPAKSRALEELADHMHHIDYGRQAALMERFAAEPWAEGCPAFRRIARAWATRDVEAAAAWAEKLPAATRGQALPEVVKRWADTESAAAGAWLEAQTNSPDFSNLRAIFLQQLQNQQSPELSAWNARLGQRTK